MFKTCWPRCGLWMALVLGCVARIAHAEAVQVAVAANFLMPMKAIALAFEQQTNHKVVISSGSTGELFAQISHGAPHQVLLAADELRPRLAEQQGLAVRGSRLTYALGRLAVWSPNPGLIDVGLDVLKQARFSRLAKANPQLAPYGVATEQVVSQLGLSPVLASKWVTLNSVGQAFQVVASGNVPLGFVAWSQVKAHDPDGKGSVWLVPARLHQPLLQDAVLLTRGQHSVAAQSLMVFLKQPQTQAMIQQFGYDIPAAQ